MFKTLSRLMSPANMVTRAQMWSSCMSIIQTAAHDIRTLLYQIPSEEIASEPRSSGTKSPNFTASTESPRDSFPLHAQAPSAYLLGKESRTFTPPRWSKRSKQIPNRPVIHNEATPGGKHTNNTRSNNPHLNDENSDDTYVFEPNPSPYASTNPHITPFSQLSNSHQSIPPESTDAYFVPDQTIPARRISRRERMTREKTPFYPRQSSLQKTVLNEFQDTSHVIGSLDTPRVNLVDVQTPETSAPLFKGSDLCVRTSNGLIFEGNPGRNYPVDSVRDLPFHPQIRLPDGSRIQNPLYMSSVFNLRNKRNREGRIIWHRPVVTGYVAGLDPTVSRLPEGVDIVFFSKVRDHYVSEENTDPDTASDETWVAAFDQQGNLFPGVVPFTIPLSRISAAYDADYHRIIVIGNRDSQSSTPRLAWASPIATLHRVDADALPVIAALRAIHRDFPLCYINYDNRENQLFICEGKPILISAKTGQEVSISAARTVEELPEVTQMITKTRLDSYGASAIISFAHDPDDTVIITVDGMYSIFNTNLQNSSSRIDVNYLPEIYTYTATITFPQINTIRKNT